MLAFVLSVFCLTRVIALVSCPQGIYLQLSTSSAEDEREVDWEIRRLVNSSYETVLEGEHIWNQENDPLPVYTPCYDISPYPNNTCYGIVVKHRDYPKGGRLSFDLFVYESIIEV